MARKDFLNKQRFHRLLDQTIQEYEQLAQAASGYALVSSLVSSLQGLKQSFNVQTRRSYKEGLKDRQLRGLNEIFSFYAKQLQMVGKSPTFDLLTQHGQIWSMGKFFKFCADFALMGKARDERRLSKAQVSQIFKQTAHNSINMDVRQFYSALDLVAELFFNSEYQASTGKKVAQLSLDEKRQLLYEYIGCENHTAYTAKLKGFGLPFSKERAGFRIPEDDISKRYKYNDPRRVRPMPSQLPKPERPQEQSLPDMRSFATPKRPQVKALKAGYLKNLDSFTWNQLNGMRHNDFIKNDDLYSIFTPEDVKELQARSKKH